MADLTYYRNYCGNRLAVGKYHGLVRAKRIQNFWLAV